MLPSIESYNGHIFLGKLNTLWKYSSPDKMQKYILFAHEFRARESILNGSILYLAVSNSVAEADCTSFQWPRFLNSLRLI